MQNLHVNVELQHPTLFPVYDHNSISLEAVPPNPILSTAGSETATMLCSVCVCVCVCVPQQARGMNSLHRNVQLSLRCFTSKHLLYVFDKFLLALPNP